MYLKKFSAHAHYPTITARIQTLKEYDDSLWFCISDGFLHWFGCQKSKSVDMITRAVVQSIVSLMSLLSVNSVSVSVKLI